MDSIVPMIDRKHGSLHNAPLPSARQALKQKKQVFSLNIQIILTHPNQRPRPAYCVLGRKRGLQCNGTMTGPRHVSTSVH